MTATEVCTDLPRELWGPRLPHPYRRYYKGLKTEAHYDGIVATIKVNKEAK